MKKIKKYLKKHLTKERYQHTLGVAYTATAMAMKYNPDTTNSDFIRKAELAGLLHDCAKNIPLESAIELCERFGIVLDDIEKKNPALIHAPLGAEVAKRDFGLNDEDA